MMSQQANNHEASSTPAESTGGVRRVVRYLVGVAWLMNAALLVAAFGWIYWFGESRDVIERLRYRLGVADPKSWLVVRDPSRLGIGVTIGTVAVIVAIITLAVIFGSLFFGGRRFQTLRMWLVLTALVCGWLGLAVSWPDIYWRGQQARADVVLPAAESFARELNAYWPHEDGELPGVGGFQAYPFGEPSMLMTFGDAHFPDSELRFPSIERSGDGVLRFELADGEGGAWLEWRRDDSEPHSFKGGLETNYELTRVARLAPGWFLVRYVAHGG